MAAIAQAAGMYHDILPLSRAQIRGQSHLTHPPKPKHRDLSRHRMAFPNWEAPNGAGQNATRRFDSQKQMSNYWTSMPVSQLPSEPRP